MEQYTDITNQIIADVEDGNFDEVRFGAIEIHDLLGEVTEDWSERHSELWDMAMQFINATAEDLSEANPRHLIETIEGAAPKDGE